MRKLALKRRELIALLEHNGFTALGRRSTSHARYKGLVGGRVCFVDVDESIDEFSPGSGQVLHNIVSGQLRFFGHDDTPIKEGWRRFYGGHPDIARRAGVSYRRWA